jgi:hypothetical protein
VGKGALASTMILVCQPRPKQDRPILTCVAIPDKSCHNVPPRGPARFAGGFAGGHHHGVDHVHGGVGSSAFSAAWTASLITCRIAAASRSAVSVIESFHRSDAAVNSTASA